MHRATPILMETVPRLAPGASLTITVTFSPTRENAQQSQVIIRTDDPIQPESRVSLAGNMNPGCIEVSPTELEWMGPSQVWTESPVISVSNCGRIPWCSTASLSCLEPMHSSSERDSTQLSFHTRCRCRTTVVQSELRPPLSPHVSWASGGALQ